MKISGAAQLHGPADKVWETMLDPEVLVRTIPGCERLVTKGEHAYAMTVTTGVASIKGTYTGSVQLRELNPPRSLTLKVGGSGSSGTIGADIDVSLADNGEGKTYLSYKADAVVGGTIGGVGQRILISASKRMANEFFRNIDGVLTGEGVEVAPEPAMGVPAPVAAGAETAAPEAAPAAREAGASPEVGTIFTRPPKQQRPRTFVSGMLVGGGLVLAGVGVGVGATVAGAAVSGWVLARRRRRES